MEDLPSNWTTVGRGDKFSQQASQDINLATEFPFDMGAEVWQAHGDDSWMYDTSILPEVSMDDVLAGYDDWPFLDAGSGWPTHTSNSSIPDLEIPMDFLPTSMTRSNQFLSPDSHHMIRQSLVSSNLNADLDAFSIFTDNDRLTDETALLDHGSQLRSAPNIVQRKADRPSPRAPLPPTFQLKDGMNTFRLEIPLDGNNPASRKRRAYSPNRAKEIASMRKRGVCALCRHLKKPCSTGEPCATCLAKAGSQKLGRYICNRDSFVSHTSNFLYGFATNCGKSAVPPSIFTLHDRLKDEPPVGRPRQVYLTAAFDDIYGADIPLHERPRLEVLVHDVSVEINYVHIRIYQKLGKREKEVVNEMGDYPVICGGLPELGTLYAWAETIIKLKKKEKGLDYKSTHTFLHHYSKRRMGNAFAHDLINHTLTLITLMEYVHDLPFLYNSQELVQCPGKFTRKPITFMIWKQLASIVLKEIKSSESHIFSLLDTLFSSPKLNITRETAIPISIAIWCLILHYGKWVMHFDFKEKEQMNTTKEEKEWVNFIYNKLIATYAVLFPSYEGPMNCFNDEGEYRDALGGDEVLIEAFENLKHMSSDCKNEDFMACSILLKKLIYDRKKRNHKKESWDCRG